MVGGAERHRLSRPIPPTDIAERDIQDPSDLFPFPHPLTHVFVSQMSRGTHRS